jgi:hypothetical protein
MTALQQHQPQFYQGLCQSVSPEDQDVIQSVVTKAEQSMMAQMALAQQHGANLAQAQAQAMATQQGQPGVNGGGAQGS